MLTAGGMLFLGSYGVLALRRALRPATLPAAEGGTPLALRAAVLQALGFALLNPHAYLDTLAAAGQPRHAAAGPREVGLRRVGRRGQHAVVQRAVVQRAGVWRALAGAGVRAAARVAGAGRADRAGDAGPGGGAGLTVVGRALLGWAALLPVDSASGSEAACAAGSHGWIAATNGAYRPIGDIGPADLGTSKVTVNPHKCTREVSRGRPSALTEAVDIDAAQGRPGVSAIAVPPKLPGGSACCHPWRPSHTYPERPYFVPPSRPSCSSTRTNWSFSSRTLYGSYLTFQIGFSFLLVA